LSAYVLPTPEAESGDTRPPLVLLAQPPSPRLGAYVLGERLFRDTLARERRRADRVGAAFAVIVLDRTLVDGASTAWQDVLEVVASARRDLDVTGWLERDAVLGIILPDVSAARGLRQSRRLRQRLVARLGAAASAGISIRLYTHCGVQEAEGTHPPVDLLIENFVTAQRRASGDTAKRILDVIASAGLLFLFSPIMLLAYLAVKCTSRGPALFRQVRIGQRGEPFTMLKFRSMRVNADSAIHKDYVTWFITASAQQPQAQGAVFKLTADPRITRVGHWLRKTSLDELPQFWNVLRGDMSLVGPRPPLPFEVDKYQPWHRRRVLDARPGLTGLWQVKGRSRTTFDEMVRMDLTYARTRSLWTDLRILAATPLAMLKGAL
jgi:lipopolysaccharide/colanic/teichoic acid biosynthesis glycosyltransferase